LHSPPGIEKEAPSSSRRERIWTTAFCVSISLQLARSVHSAWQALWAAPALDGPAPVRYAPAGYRIAIPPVLGLIRRFFTPRDAAAAFAGLDFVCILGTLLIYCTILQRKECFRGLSTGQRLLPSALFLAFVQIPLAWVTPWLRPETTPTALYVAAALFCLISSRSNRAWLIVLCVMTVWQSFVRSDVPAVLGLSILLVGLMARSLKEIASRKQYILCGAAVLVIAVAIQGYLQFVLFPHLTYPPGTTVMQWRDNLQRHNLVVAGIVLLPAALLVALVRVQGAALDAVDWIALVGSGLYLVLWYLVANLAEVRLYVPFLFALSLVAARVLSAWLLDEQSGAAAA